VNSKRGFTLLEMIIATLIMAIAITGLLSGISGATRNAARLREYDRVVQLARLRMDDLLVDYRAPRNVVLEGGYDPSLTGGMQAGWRAQVTPFERPAALTPGALALEQIKLEIWWISGSERRTFALESLRKTGLTLQDIPGATP
jgi:general secretion pathway protein I